MVPVDTIPSLLLKGMTLVLPSGILQGDILLESGKITAIGPNLPRHAATIIETPHLTVFPGFIDSHVHFREPGATHKETIETGSRAAVAGGITSFFEMPNTSPATTTQAALDDKLARAAQTSYCNYAFFIGATPENLTHLDTIGPAPAVKLFAGSSTGDLLVNKTADWETLFRHTTRIISTHSEDDALIHTASIDNATAADHPSIRSTEAAITCTKRLVTLALTHNRRLHICHLTTKDECDFLASLNSPLITTEVTPQHLHFTDAAYAKHQNFLKINPPIRASYHRDALWQALKAGVIPFIASDHAPHTRAEKEQPYLTAPSGMPIVEFTVPLLLTYYAQKKVSLQQIATWLSHAPAQCYRVKNKGKLAVGYDADITIVDTERTQLVRSIHSKSGWSALENTTLTGWPVMTLVNGQIAYRDGDFYRGAARPVVFA